MNTQKRIGLILIVIGILLPISMLAFTNTYYSQLGFIYNLQRMDVELFKSSIPYTRSVHTFVKNRYTDIGDLSHFRDQLQHAENRIYLYNSMLENNRIESFDFFEMKIIDELTDFYTKFPYSNIFIVGIGLILIGIVLMVVSPKERT